MQQFHPECIAVYMRRQELMKNRFCSFKYNAVVSDVITTYYFLVLDHKHEWETQGRILERNLERSLLL